MLTRVCSHLTGMLKQGPCDRNADAHIAQVAPLFESVPPKLYGGTERVVSVLTEELVSRGHEVTLFASGDSVTGATLASCSDLSLRLEGTVRDHVALTTIQLARVFDRQGEFDLIHNHVDYFAFPFARQSLTPMLYHDARPPGSRRDPQRLRILRRSAPGLNSAWATPAVAEQPLARHRLQRHRLQSVQPGIRSRGSTLLCLDGICPEERPDRRSR